MLTQNANFVMKALRGDFSTAKCGPDAATTPVVCASGLEIEFYSSLTTE